jgi:hypothetical protein
MTEPMGQKEVGQESLSKGTMAQRGPISRKQDGMEENNK